LALSWVGTGRVVFSLNYTDAQLQEVLERWVAACRHMAHDGWWWQAEGASFRDVRRSVWRELLRQRIGLTR